jgi:hypothetical protein
MISTKTVLDYYEFLDHAESVLHLNRDVIDDVLMNLCDGRVPHDEYVSVSLYDYLYEDKSSDEKLVISEMKKVAGASHILVYAP